MPVLLECSGNGRVFLKPPQVGIRWELGAVSTALWTGVPLADVLDEAGVKPTAVEVILEGADHGEFTEPNPKTPGAISYARSLPMAKAKAPEVLLAYQMNGHDLPPRHGQPVRAVVAGWYGMASVKWLRRIIITDRPFHGYFQSFMYATWERQHGLPTPDRPLARSRSRRRSLAQRLRGGSKGIELQDARSGMGRRIECCPCRGQCRWRPDLGRGEAARRPGAVRLAALGVRLDHARASRSACRHGEGDRSSAASPSRTSATPIAATLSSITFYRSRSKCDELDIDVRRPPLHTFFCHS